MVSRWPQVLMAFLALVNTIRYKMFTAPKQLNMNIECQDFAITSHQQLKSAKLQDVRYQIILLFTK